jgi:hypothetical protein
MYIGAGYLRHLTWPCTEHTGKNMDLYICISACPPRCLLGVNVNKNLLSNLSAMLPQLLALLAPGRQVPGFFFFISPLKPDVLLSLHLGFRFVPCNVGERKFRV